MFKLYKLSTKEGNLTIGDWNSLLQLVVSMTLLKPKIHLDCSYLHRQRFKYVLKASLSLVGHLFT
jgi:hypothetical protein